MRDRSWRRGRRELAIARARKRILDRDFRFGGVNWWDDHMNDLAAAAGREARTPHPCSRYCCGNPRRHFDGSERYTRQEHKWFLSAVEQESEAHTNNNHAAEDVDGRAEDVGKDNGWSRE